MTEQTPATEAGREFVSIVDNLGRGTIEVTRDYLRDRILAIEAEARAGDSETIEHYVVLLRTARVAALREAAERVRALDIRSESYGETIMAVLAILDPQP